MAGYDADTLSGFLAEAISGYTGRLASSALRRTVLKRGFDALLELIGTYDEKDLESIASAPSREDVLARILLAETRYIEESPDPLLEARLRGAGKSVELLRIAGGTLSSAEVAVILGVTRQAVDKRRKSGSLLALSTGKKGFRYPACQFTETGLLPGLSETIRGLGATDAWMKLAFLVNGNVRLDGRTPIEMLRQGELDAVLDAASACGEHGAA